jgi:hypothetical protein
MECFGTTDDGAKPSDAQTIILKEVGQDLTSESNGSKAKMAGRRPAAGWSVRNMPASASFRVILWAFAAGIWGVAVNWLFLNTGLANTKSNAWIAHFDDSKLMKIRFISS